MTSTTCLVHFLLPLLHYYYLRFLLIVGNCPGTYTSQGASSPTSSLAFVHLFSLPAVDLSFKLQVRLQHILSQRLPVERVIGCGEDVPLNVFPVAAIAAGQYHWVLHQLPHDCALKFTRYIVPFNLLLHSLNNQFVCSLSQGSKLSNVC